MLLSFDINNKCSKNKIKEPLKSILEKSMAELLETERNITTIYLVGSLGRGEFEEGFSDINIYIINNIEDEGLVLMEDQIFTFYIFTQGKFLSDACKKYRIIAKADGILLHGKDFVKDEQLKASPLLALTLNEE